MKTVVARYHDQRAAEEAMLELSSHGFEQRHISLDPDRSDMEASVRVTVEDDQIEEVARLLEQTASSELHHEDATSMPTGSADSRRERGAVGDSRPTADATSHSPAAGQMRPALDELFQKHEPQFREHFRSHGGSSETYDQYRQAYLEGTRLGTEFQSRDWSEVEQEGRRRWEHNQHSHPWAKVRDYVKHGWGQVNR